MRRAALDLGELDQRVVFQRKTRTQDGAGGAAKSWSDVATVWAHVRPLRGRERQDGGRAEGVREYLVVVRWRDDLLDGDRIEWRGRYLNIRFPQDRGRRSEYLEIEAEMGVAS